MQKPYPAVLTNKDWQNKKGLLAKLKIGETGVGAKLAAVESAFNEVTWEHFEVSFEYKNLNIWKLSYEGCKNTFQNKVVPLINKTRAAGTHAKEKREELKDKASKDVLKALQAIQEAAEQFVLTLKNYGDVGREYEKVKPSEQVLQMQQKQVEQKVNNTVKIEPLIVNARKAATGWSTGGKVDESSWNAVRGLVAVVSRTPGFEPVAKDASELSSLGRDKINDTKVHGQNVLKLIGRIEQLASKK